MWSPNACTYTGKPPPGPKACTYTTTCTYTAAQQQLAIFLEPQAVEVDRHKIDPEMLEGALTSNDTLPCRLLAKKLLDNDVAAEPRLPL